MGHIKDIYGRGVGPLMVKELDLLDSFCNEVRRAINVENFIVNKSFKLEEGDSKLFQFLQNF